MQQINVQEIMEQIKAEIKEKGYTEDMLSFHDIPLANIKLAEQMREAAYIAWRRPVPGGVKGFVKRIIRKCIGFVVAPITEDQTDFNYLTAAMAEELYTIIEEQQKELCEQRKLILQLKNQCIRH